MGMFHSKNKPEETKASFNPYKCDDAPSSTPPLTCLFLEKGDDTKYDRKKDTSFVLISHEENSSLYISVVDVKYKKNKKNNNIELTLKNNEKRIIPESVFVKYTYKNQPLSELKNGEYDVLIVDGNKVM